MVWFYDLLGRTCIDIRSACIVSEDFEVIVSLVVGRPRSLGAALKHLHYAARDLAIDGDDFLEVYVYVIV